MQPVPDEALPTQEFVEMVNRIETPRKVTESSPTNDGDVIMVNTPSGPVPLKKGKIVEYEGNSPPVIVKAPEPIVLEYRFTGQCRKHMTEVSTLTAEVDGKCIAFAFCKECNKNILSQTVPLLNKVYFEEIGLNKPKRRFKRKGKELNGNS